MKESTKKKKTTSTSEPSNSKAKVVSSDSSTTTLLLVVILVLGVVQLLVTVTMVGGESDVSSDMEEKIDRLDAFFASNAPGYGDSDGNVAPTDNQVAPTAPQVGEPDIEGRAFIGNADAKVTIVEYSDFECPFCAKFYSETYSQLKDAYIATGDVKLVFKDFPLSFHQLAEPSAIASKCVFREVGNEAFFTFHDKVFENQVLLSVANLKAWAIEAGVDSDAYDSCIGDPTIAAQVQADFAEGQAFGVSGTPSFIINGQLLVGAQPFSAFEQVIDAALQ